MDPDRNLIWLVPSVATCLALLIRYEIGAGMLVVLMMMPQSLLPTRLFGVTGFNAINLPALVLIGCALFQTQRAAGYDKRLHSAFWITAAVMAVAVIRSALDFDALARIESHSLASASTGAAYVRDYLLKPIQVLLVLWLVARTFQSEERQRYLLLGCVVGFSVGCLVIMINSGMLNMFAQGIVPDVKSDRELQEAFGTYANSLQLKLGFLLIVSATLFIWGTQAAGRIVLALCAPVLLLTLWSCHSRASLLSFVAGAAVFVALQRSHSVRWVVGGLCAAIFLMSLIAVPSYRAKAIDVVTVGPWWALYAEREDIWDPLRHDVKRHFLLGNGRHAMMRSPRYDEINLHEGGGGIDHPHNAFLEFQLDAGIVGVGAAFWLVWRAVAAMRRRLYGVAGQTAVSAAAGLCALAVFAASALSGQSLYPQHDTVVLFLLLFLGCMPPRVPPPLFTPASAGS